MSLRYINRFKEVRCAPGNRYQQSLHINNIGTVIDCQKRAGRGPVSMLRLASSSLLKRCE